MKKVCSKCNENKSFSEFHKDSSHKTGVDRHCKLCKKEYNSAYVKNNNQVKTIMKRYSDYRIAKSLAYGKSIIPRIKIDIPTPNFALMIDRIKLSEPIEDYTNALTVGDFNQLTNNQKLNYV